MSLQEICFLREEVPLPMYKDTLRHFILTRFNLFLWNKDKEGNKVRSREWLEHRFELFERYCLPSIKNQTCKSFKWIVLFDSTTPDAFKARIGEWQKGCSQLIPVYVESKDGHRFAQIFREEVVQMLGLNQELENSRYSSTNTDDTNHTDKCFNRVLTTYLDNDDALSIHFVEDLQRRAADLSDGTFIYYRDGYQLFTDHQYLMKIHYPRNHFASVVEDGNPTTLKTIYGYGSHYYIDKIKGAKIEYVKDLPMWCEVIHEKNMGNDAYFLKAKMVHDEDILHREFALDETVKYGVGIYIFRFLPRYLKTFVKRIGYRLFGRKW